MRFVPKIVSLPLLFELSSMSRKDEGEDAALPAGLSSVLGNHIEAEIPIPILVLPSRREDCASVSARAQVKFAMESVVYGRKS